MRRCYSVELVEWKMKISACLYTKSIPFLGLENYVRNLIYLFIVNFNFRN